jgi:hypothetical protein
MLPKRNFISNLQYQSLRLALYNSRQQNLRLEKENCKLRLEITDLQNELNEYCIQVPVIDFSIMSINKYIL